MVTTITRNFILAFITFFFLYGQPFVFAEIIDRSVAIVNNDVITLSEVNELGKPLFQRIIEQTPPEQLEETLQQAKISVIESIIDEKLLLGEAKRHNITVSDQELNNAIENIIIRNQTSREALTREISRMGLSEEEYRENLRRQILKSKLVNIAVHSKIVITEEAIIDYYNTSYGKEISDGGYYLLQIGVSYDQNIGDPKNSRAVALKRIKQIRKQALAGADFEKLAREHSEMPSYAYGGDIGVLQENEMAPGMHKAVTGLEPGDISVIVETGAALQIFKLLSRQDGQVISKVPLETVKESIRETLQEKESRRLYDNWIQEIRRHAYIRII